MTPDQKELALLHCPFCGGIPYLAEWIYNDGALSLNEGQVRCNCGASGPKIGSNDVGVVCSGHWNTRMKESPVTLAQAKAQEGECPGDLREVSGEAEVRQLAREAASDLKRMLTPATPPTFEQAKAQVWNAHIPAERARFAARRNGLMRPEGDKTHQAPSPVATTGQEEVEELIALYRELERVRADRDEAQRQLAVAWGHSDELQAQIKRMKSLGDEMHESLVMRGGYPNEGLLKQWQAASSEKGEEK